MGCGAPGQRRIGAQVMRLDTTVCTGNGPGDICTASGQSGPIIVGPLLEFRTGSVGRANLKRRDDNERITCLPLRSHKDPTITCLSLWLDSSCTIIQVASVAALRIVMCLFSSLQHLLSTNPNPMCLPLVQPLAHHMRNHMTLI